MRGSLARRDSSARFVTLSIRICRFSISALRMCVYCRYTNTDSAAMVALAIPRPIITASLTRMLIVEEVSSGFGAPLLYAVQGFSGLGVGRVDLQDAQEHRGGLQVLAAGVMLHAFLIKRGNVAGVPGSFNGF